MNIFAFTKQMVEATETEIIILGMPQKYVYLNQLATCPRVHVASLQGLEIKWTPNIQTIHRD